ncbi:cyclic lactone autoinducer peptide [Clostridium aciditolerans]|uniref:Cyclic lactone autoinducer peptide n=1 Tax=Clostridium aciditolerans TaxID=339861 RepID=A0A934M4Q4_9CLOT|nr:cyclic lactone autoinducer peptide [Clostridium aciditolerans]MBI6874275.1 cyclic lactone autoinducer peptide [Clostridium aciditolerans]
MKNSQNKILKGVLMLATSFFTFFALSTSASACAWCFHQPKEPRCLRDE